MGIVLTDTFNLNECLVGIFLSENSEWARRQQEARIEVIVGAPPWSARQKSSATDDTNVSGSEVEARIADTYAARFIAINKNSIYDTYETAIPEDGFPFS